ncbi:MAG: 16S rRNA (uracil(1498)-N(3))-methyltransferase [Rickettsiales bacterium]|nr:16S rRNA (uracil(1498)-N(3))-methyltransferase [Rickettsiales bacterium]
MASSPKIRLCVEHGLSAGIQFELVDEQANYVARVMRAKSGDRLALFNGKDGEWSATILEASRKRVHVRIDECLREYIAPPQVWMCFAPIKFGRIDYLAQKVTELGAAHIQPVLTQYTQADRVNKKRLRGNMVEAAEQCERVEVPELHEPIGLRELLAEWPKDRPLYFGDERGAGIEGKAIFDEPKPKEWGILIGPEGGFSPEEHELLQLMPFTKAVNLGPRILRADTAALTLLSLTQCAFGDWHIAPHFSFHD